MKTIVIHIPYYIIGGALSGGTSREIPGLFAPPDSRTSISNISTYVWCVWSSWLTLLPSLPRLESPRVQHEKDLWLWNMCENQIDIWQNGMIEWNIWQILVPQGTENTFGVGWNPQRPPNGLSLTWRYCLLTTLLAHGSTTQGYFYISWWGSCKRKGTSCLRFISSPKVWFSMCKLDDFLQPHWPPHWQVAAACLLSWHDHVIWATE